MEGVTCDDVKLRVAIWSDAGVPVIKVTDVQKI
jgi:hypothetical protein